MNPQGRDRKLMLLLVLFGVPSLGCESDPQKALGAYRQAVQSAEREDWSSAIQYCTKAIELSPGFAFAYNRRASAAFEKGDCNAAIQDYVKSVELFAKTSSTLDPNGPGDILGNPVVQRENLLTFGPDSPEHESERVADFALHNERSCPAAILQNCKAWWNQLMQGETGLSYPLSQSRKPIDCAVGIRLTQEYLAIGESRIARLREGRFLDGDDWAGDPKNLLPLLQARPSHGDSQNEKAASFSPNGAPVSINLAADRHLPFGSLFRVLQAAAQVGTSHFGLLARPQWMLNLAEPFLVSIPVSIEAAKPGSHDGTPPTASVPPSGKAVLLTVQIQGVSVQLAASGSQPQQELAGLKASIPPQSGSLDGAALTKWAITIHDRYPQSDTVTLVPEAKTPVQVVVQAIDALRYRPVPPEGGQPTALFPVVLLGSIGKQDHSKVSKASDPAPEPPEEPTLGLQGKGSLGREAIMKVVGQHAREVRFCSRKGLRERTGLAGSVVLEWTIGRNGSVSKIKISSDDTGIPALTKCLSSKIRSWKFPKPKGGEVIVTYPFRFKADDSPAN